LFKNIEFDIYQSIYVKGLDLSIGKRKKFKKTEKWKGIHLKFYNFRDGLKFNILMIDFYNNVYEILSFKL